MKKRFMVEVEYDEKEENVLNDSHVFYDTALECCIENLMYDYERYGSIGEKYSVSVTEVK